MPNPTTGDSCSGCTRMDRDSRRSYIVFHIALGAPINNSAEATHASIDRRRPVFAHVSDDGRLTSAKNEARLAGRLIASVCANQIGGNADCAFRCSTDRCSTGGANRCAGRSRKQAQQGANAHGNDGSQGRVRLLGIDLEIARGVPMNHRGSVYRDFCGVVELPARCRNSRVRRIAADPGNRVALTLRVLLDS
jgi:hypothetical protein